MGNKGVKEELVVKEGVEGVWRFHIAELNKYIALCGMDVMNSNIKLEDWGILCGNFEIHYKWCNECDEWIESMEAKEGEFK